MWPLSEKRRGYISRDSDPIVIAIVVVIETSSKGPTVIRPDPMRNRRPSGSDTRFQQWLADIACRIASSRGTDWTSRHHNGGGGSAADQQISFPSDREISFLLAAARRTRTCCGGNKSECRRCLSIAATTVALRVTMQCLGPPKIMMTRMSLSNPRAGAAAPSSWSMRCDVKIKLHTRC